MFIQIFVMNCTSSMFLTTIHTFKFIVWAKGCSGGRGGSSICRWTGNEDFQYDISRFWEKYGREQVFSTLDCAGNY